MKEKKMTPMMVQYLETKEEYKDTILFYRLGDFYEMFFDDAKTVSRELELTLTGKDCGLDERAPMCGVPFHSVSTYIARLIDKGYKVAVCEQVEDPKEAKGLVKREVVRVITPGTVIEEDILSGSKNNYLAAVYSDGVNYGMTFTDISTSEVYSTYVSDSGLAVDEIAKYSPTEIIVNDKVGRSFIEMVDYKLKLKASVLIDEFFEFDDVDLMIKKQFPNCTLSDACHSVLKKSVCTVIRYMEHTQKSSFEYLNVLNIYSVDEYMEIDADTRRNLEITETMRDKKKHGSLLGVLDKTKTSMGVRLLKQWLEKPLLNTDMICRRLNGVDEILKNVMARDRLTELLDGIYDISRITSRISLGNVTPKDLLSLKQSLQMLPDIKQVLQGFESKILKGLYDGLDTMEEMYEYLECSIDEEAGSLLRDDKIIKRGFNEELDKLRLAKDKGTQWVHELEAKERESTGIKTLKVRYNKVFGYYIDVTKTNAGSVPDYYVRKQTLVNSERYITPELKTLENTILGANEKQIALEHSLFRGIVDKLKNEAESLKTVCYIISVLDVLCSLATVAYINGYVKPEITDDGSINIVDGRHPVVESLARDSIFVPNDTKLDTADNRLMIITGPNMAGKSTYMRQVAVITLMAQIGSFVPASFARIGLVDKIFTRVGASDDIASGRSTFMVEMSEVAHILTYATNKSLIILDEIGRGTSTYDGLSIAWSVAEYVLNSKNLGAKTLFATHYHELTELEEKLGGVKNYNIAVKKHGDNITFLRKIVPGGADESYGIEVAALAGVPKPVLKRAKEILSSIECGGVGTVKIKAREKKVQIQDEQLSFSDNSANIIADELKMLDVTTLTPIEALNKLFELSKKAKEI